MSVTGFTLFNVFIGLVAIWYIICHSKSDLEKINELVIDANKNFDGGNPIFMYNHDLLGYCVSDDTIRLISRNSTPYELHNCQNWGLNQIIATDVYRNIQLYGKKHNPFNLG
ncbi:hypothetical protein [Methanosphaera sp.]|jgi:hypothetical protein|uniref:hypothetical protein n=1 Tax=Methanosphaera sp. TaxID=2666342 RepID=UPI003D8B178E